MDRSLRAGRGLALCLVLFSAPPCAQAADEEIEVYLDDLAAPGHFGLDVHTNYVASGERVVAYPGADASLHRLRLTPEFAYGLTASVELGLYAPLLTIDQAGRFDAGGIKLRVKYIAPKPAAAAWFWGANLELGRVDHALDANPDNGELKLIAGTRHGPWTLGLNANIDFRISGDQPSPTTLQWATKLTRTVQEGLDVGLESYNGMGSVRHPVGLGQDEQSSFLVIDKSLRDWDLNLGLGRGYGTNPDRFIIKAIIGVPIERLARRPAGL